MGEGAPGAGHACPRSGELAVSRRTTIAELEDWERNGAVWRAVELSEDRAVVDLCACTGELMERVETDDPEVIAFVRADPDDD